MRLTPIQIQTVQRCVEATLGADARVRVFGSRLDDTRRGGDLDLLIDLPSPPALLSRARLKQLLESQLDLPVDLVIAVHGSTPSAFVRLAMAKGQCL
jgi:hypothetical protein